MIGRKNCPRYFDALEPIYCKVVLEQGIRGGLQMTAALCAKYNKYDIQMVGSTY
jgi:hypothetical protein